MLEPKMQQEEPNDADWRLTKKEWDEHKDALAELQNGFKVFRAEVQKQIDEGRMDVKNLKQEFEEFKVLVLKKIEEGRADLLKAFALFQVEVQKQIDDHKAQIDSRFDQLLAEIKLIGVSQAITIRKITNMDQYMQAMGKEVLSINKYIHRPKHYEWNQQHKSNKDRKFFKKVRKQHYIYTDEPMTPEKQIEPPPITSSPLISESSKPVTVPSPEW